MSSSADRNLLFGVLALQLNFIARDQLVAAMNEWVRAKDRPLADLLVSMGTLSAARRKLLDPLVEEHLKQHGNDAQRSLAVLGADETIGAELSLIGDPQLAATIPHLGSAQTLPELSETSVGQTTGQGSRFRVLRPHARGGLGRVLVAQDEELNREVAIKEILPKYADDAGARARFILEAEITGGLEHPGIVPVYGLGTFPDGRPFYAMRFIKGDSLKDAISRYHLSRSEERTLELRQLLGRFIDVCQAIEYAHSRGVLHRDLKPGNIMLGKYGETLVVDWGLAKAQGQVDPSETMHSEMAFTPASGSSVEPTQMGTMIGTLQYMSPEQAAGRLDVLGPASDVYSLGATLYHLLAGRAPIMPDDPGDPLRRAQTGDFPSPRRVLTTVPLGLDAICRRAMALAPSERYASPQALADDLERWLADESLQAAPDSVSQRWARWGRKHKGWVQAGGIATILLAVVSLGAALLVNGQRRYAEKQRELALSLANKNLGLANEKQLALNQSEIRRIEAEQARKLAVAAGQAADEARGLERVAKEQALEAQITAETRLAESRLSTGRSLCEQGEIPSGLLWMARALTALPQHSADLEQLIRANLGAWSVRAHSAQLAVAQSSNVRSVAFSPLGEQFATACDDGSIRIWSAATGKPKAFSVRHPAPLCVAFSPDGKLLASGGRDRTLRLWNVETGEPAGKPCLHDGDVYSIAFHPRGEVVAVGCETGKAGSGLRLWEVATCEPTGAQFDVGGGVFALAFSSSGKRILTGGIRASQGEGSGWAQLWDAETGLPVGAAMRQRFRIVTVAISPDNKTLATGSWDSFARLWDAETSRPVGPPLRHTGSVTSLRFSPDGKSVLTGCDSGNAYLWDAQSGERVGQRIPYSGPVYGVDFSPDGTRVLVAGNEQFAWLWSIVSSGSDGPPLAAPGGAGGVAFNDDGTLAVAGAQLWDLTNRQALGQPLIRDLPFLSAAFSPDQRRVVLGTRAHQTPIVDLASRSVVGKLLQHGGPISGVRFSPDGKLVATAAHDRTGQLWDVETGERVGKPLQHDSNVWSVAFHPTERIVATGSENGKVYLWDAVEGTQIGEPLISPKRVTEIAFDPAGSLLAIGGMDNLVRFWDFKTREFRDPPLLHVSYVARLTFSPNGKFLATGCNDKGLRIWDMATRKLIGPCFWHEGPVLAVAFNSTGDRLLTATEHPGAELWRLPPPSSGLPAQIEAQISATTREELTLSGEIRILDAGPWEQRRSAVTPTR